MRSRYTAYVLRLEDYLLATWAVQTRPATLNLNADIGTRWLGLKILRSENPLTNPPIDQSSATAIVEFVARYRQGSGAASRLHEVSRFVRENGCWYYVDGTILDGVDRSS